MEPSPFLNNFNFKTTTLGDLWQSKCFAFLRYIKILSRLCASQVGRLVNSYLKLHNLHIENGKRLTTT